MEHLRRRSAAAACTQIFALLLVMTHASDAQTWHWKYVTHTSHGPLPAAQSTVAISANDLRMSYIVPLQKRQLVIESCRADLRDVQNADTVRTQGVSYLLVHFKPSRAAACVSGRYAVALPADDERHAKTIAAAINRSSRTAAGAAVPATPATTGPAAVAHAAPPPNPAAPTAPAEPSALQDWVENDGIFGFVRMRNISRARITPTGEVFDCRNVQVGCGPFAPTRLDPGGTATVATVAAANGATAPTFRYRYNAADGKRAVGGSGSSSTLPPRHVERMSADELRAAQTDAFVELRSPRTAPGPIATARLVKRGSSRLAIGQTGTVVIRLTIAANGTPQEADIVSITNRQLAAAAIETAVSSTYAPAIQNGRAVAAKYIATFSFDGEDPALASVPVWKRPAGAAAPPAASGVTSPPAGSGAAAPPAASGLTSPPAASGVTSPPGASGLTSPPADSDSTLPEAGPSPNPPATARAEAAKAPSR